MARIAVVLNSSWNIYNFRLPLMEFLSGKGHELIAMAPRDDYSERIPYEYRELDFTSRSVSPWQNLRQLTRFIQAFRSVKPDLALLYTIKPNIYGNIAARLAKVPTVSNVAGLGNVFIDERWVTSVARRLYRFALRHPGKVFFQNEHDCRMFVSQGLVQEQQAERIPGSGVDLDRFTPVSRQRGLGEPFVFLLASRMMWEKGVREYVEAANRILAERDDVVFRLAGPLDVDNPTAISTQEMHSLTARPGIEYIGNTDRMERELARADCFVLPSYREGLSKVLLEAAATALPIVTTRVPGCMEVVEEGGSGLLCEARHSAELEKKMREMLALTATERAAMGRRGRQIVNRSFNQQTVFEAYEKAIDKWLD